jgi:hypothetical protein
MSRAKPAKWTIMLYIAADEGLANFAIESLKQLRDTAKGEVLVAAQFDCDGSDESEEVRRFIFGKNGGVNGKPLGKIEELPSLPADTNMTEPSTLANFIDWAGQECDSDYYCLILWGHGPELLFEAPTKTDGKRLYFTPVQLKKGLQRARLPKNKHFAIIGMDACSMSMIEYAHELKDLVPFMVASQEEVPDLSFPYSRLVEHFARYSDAKALCKSGIQDYGEAYQDYLCTPGTGMKKVTLSCLQLAKIGDSANLIKDLAKALQAVAKVDHGGPLILEARKKTKGFVGGLFVDICSFCDQLLVELGPNTIPEKPRDDVKKACEALRKQVEPVSGECVIANTAADDRCHGLSIYFPYLNDDERSEIEGSHLIKGAGGPQQDTGKGAGGPQQDTGKGAGGPQQDTGKGAGGPQQDTGKSVAIANMAARDIQYAVRRALIADTEAYYRDPEFELGTMGWYDFIAQDWCRILVENEPENLDLRYSAQQLAQNLNRGKKKLGAHP